MWMVQGSDSFTEGATCSVQKRLTNTPSSSSRSGLPRRHKDLEGTHAHTHTFYTSYSSETKQLLSRFQPSEVTVSAMDLWLGWVTQYLWWTQGESPGMPAFTPGG